MNFKKIFLVFTIFLSVNLMASESSPYVRYPAINNLGDVLFVYQGDIWKLSNGTTEARRLTIHEGYEANPMWSADSKQIAFSSNRFGNNDIFVMDANGDAPKQITYHSSSDNLSDWSANGELVFTTARTFRQVEWNHEIYSISTNEGTEKRILNSVGEMPVASPDGNYIAFTKGACRISREYYEGSANNDIWLYDRKSDTFRQLTNFEGNDIYPRWANNNTLYFISAKSGNYNIYKMNISDDGFPKDEQITDFTEDGVQFLNISQDGKTLVFERFTNIYKMNPTTKQIEQIEINIGTDYRFDPIENVSASSGITEYAVSPNGKYSAIVIHGEIFVTQNEKDKSKSVNITNNPYRDENPTWLNDSTIVFVSDREGQKDLYLVKSADKSKTDLFKTFRYEYKNLTNSVDDESWPIISPDGKKIAYEVNRGKLFIFDIDSDGNMTNKVTMLDSWALPMGVVWSPDSKWISYAMDNLEFNQEIYIQSVDGKVGPVNVSMHPKVDGNPFWSQDGSKLVFISERKTNADVWFVWLNKKDWEKTKNDWKEADEPKEDKKKKDDETIEPIKIDLENIWERLVQVTNSPSDERSPAASKDGEKIYYSAVKVNGKGRELISVKWDGTKPEVVKGISEPSNLSSAEAGKYLFALSSGGKLFSIKDGSSKATSISFNAKYIIDYEAEKNQIFEEAWRTLKYGFYDPNFHGKDWNELKKHYKPMILSASTKKDFRDKFNVMLGQLDASHMGMYGDDRAKTNKVQTSLLGVEIFPKEDGVEIVRVIPNSPADKEESKLYTGDVILAINGQKIASSINYYSLLNDKGQDIIELEVVNKNGEERNVLIRPTMSLRNLLYEEWVDNNAKLVKKWSDGKLGYLHIKEMGWDSFEKFERDLTAAGYGKEGLVIDVRYNGGGWTTDYLMTVLNYKQHAYTVPRGATDNLQRDNLKFKDSYPLGERLPYSAWTKKSIALCNSRSYSNAEIFSHAYKTLGIGTLVGEPTFGAVISTGGQGLIDGSYVRLPFRAWYTLATEENQERVAATPNVVLENAPNDKANGTDTQLKKAVEILLEQK